MKKQLLENHFGTRKLLEKALAHNNLPTEGSRQYLEEKLLSLRYKDLVATAEAIKEEQLC